MTMRVAAARLEAMFHSSSWQQETPQQCCDDDSASLLSSSSSSSSSSSGCTSSSSSLPSSSSSSSLSSSSTTLHSSTPLLPFSSFFSSSLSLLDDPSLTEAMPALLEDALEEVPPFPEADQIQLYPPLLPHETVTTTSTTTLTPTTTLSLLPHVPCGTSSLVPVSLFGLDACGGEGLGSGAGACLAGGGVGAGAGGAGGSGHGGRRDLDEVEKEGRRQLKAELRKQRNKEAARRSNLNKKLIRDQLKKKSVELWEENLQLQQDIRELQDRLRHFRHMHTAMQHVCCRHQQLAPLATCP